MNFKPIWAHMGPWAHMGQMGLFEGPKVNILTDVCSGMGGQEFIRGSRGFRTIPRIPRIPYYPAEVVAATAVRNPPSTRAGVQDDVS